MREPVCIAEGTELDQWLTAESYGVPQETIRPSQTGDIIVSLDNAAFKIVGTEYGFTFERCDLQDMQKPVRLIAEFKEDSALGKEESALGSSRSDTEMF